jgi:hypothetical protein
MNTISNKIPICNPCIVKVYRGIDIKDNNYEQYQHLEQHDLLKIIKHQQKEIFTNHYNNRNSTLLINSQS